MLASGDLDENTAALKPPPPCVDIPAMSNEATRYEYVAVRLPQVVKKERDRKHTEAINAVAAHGWRLVTVHGEDSFEAIAYFERPVES